MFSLQTGRGSNEQNIVIIIVSGLIHLFKQSSCSLFSVSRVCLESIPESHTVICLVLPSWCITYRAHRSSLACLGNSSQSDSSTNQRPFVRLSSSFVCFAPSLSIFAMQVRRGVAAPLWLSLLPLFFGKIFIFIIFLFLPLSSHYTLLQLFYFSNHFLTSVNTPAHPPQPPPMPSTAQTSPSQTQTMPPTYAPAAPSSLATLASQRP